MTTPGIQGDPAELLAIARHALDAGHSGIAIPLLIKALQLTDQERDKADVRAEMQFRLGNAYRFLREGDQDTNNTNAIACYESALDTLERLPLHNSQAHRTAVLMSLGHVYRERRGSPRENLDLAIGYYRQVLESISADDTIGLARAHLCIGMAYLDRAMEPVAADAQGPGPEDDLEEAIAHLAAAVETPGLRHAPQQYASALGQLGNAYDLRRRGDRASNVEHALGYLTRWREAGGSGDPARRISLLVLTARMHMSRAGGTRSDNIEAAIKALDTAEGLVGDVVRGAAQPGTSILMFSLQQAFGDAYAARIRGDPAANREAALDYHRAAAGAVDPGSDPQAWATATGRLAGDYSQRLRGNPLENLEEAVGLNRRILDVLDAQSFPQLWAETMAGLGSVYRRRIAGDKAGNIEQAIACYQAALTVMTREASRADWAELQNNLGNAYAERIIGDRGDNLLQSAACLMAALDSISAAVVPRQWALMLANLGATYSALSAYGDPDAERQAIQCFERALTVLIPELDPAAWAQINANLGLQIMRGADSPSGARQAVEHLNAALEVFTADSAPLAWARIMYILGEIHVWGPAPDRDEAIRCLRQALTVITQDEMPAEWAQSQMMLGNAYRLHPGDLAGPVPPGELKRAAACLQPAAEVFHQLGDLTRWMGASAELAEVRADLGDWVGSMCAYKEALTASEIDYGKLILPTSKEAALKLSGRVHALAAHSAAQAGAAATAAQWLERGRARLLGDALARDRASLADLRERDPSAAARLEAAVNEQRQLDIDQARTGGDTPFVSHTDASPLRRDVIRSRDEVRRDRFRRAAAEYAAAIKAARTALGEPGFLAPEAPETLACHAAGAPLVYLAATSRGGVAVLLHGSTVDTLDLPALTELELAARVDRFLAASSTSSDAPAWTTEVDEVTRWLWTAALGEVANAIAGADILTLVPCGLLSLLPLHAAWRTDPSLPAGRRYLLDIAPIAYAPSARVLENCGPFAELPADRLLAVADPQPVNAPRLQLATQEAALAAARLRRGLVLAADQAAEAEVSAALREASVAHFACHSRADLDDPDRSGLVLAHDRLLDVARIRTLRVRLRLAILSACETARPGIRLPDEVVGLPGALLQAGAGGILASWWPVRDDLALRTMLAFYERWPVRGAETNTLASPVVALAQAQRWLRDASNGQVRAHLEELLDDPGNWMPRAVLEHAWENVVLQDPQVRQFSSPAAWGAFGYYGR